MTRDTKGRWEYYDVTEYHNSMLCERKYYGISMWNQGWTTLINAASLVGFGGIEFEERPNQWFMSLQLIEYGLRNRFLDFCGDIRVKPATPKRVRFWVEEEK